MICPFSGGIASMNGLTEAKGATSSAVFTTASVGTARLKGPTTVLPIFKICDRELAEIERRRQRYLGKRERVEIAGRTAIVIDDGIAAGATTRAAVRATRMRNPKQLVLAVPVAPTNSLAVMRQEADEVVCLEDHVPFRAIGFYYSDFRQVSDDEVIEMLTPPLSGSRARPSGQPAA